MSDSKTQTIELMQTELAQKRESLREMRFSAAGSRSRNVRAARQARRDIARILTELRAREVALETK